MIYILVAKILKHPVYFNFCKLVLWLIINCLVLIVESNFASVINSRQNLFMIIRPGAVTRSHSQVSEEAAADCQEPAGVQQSIC